jgi:hypothetical protein
VSQLKLQQSILCLWAMLECLQFYIENYLLSSIHFFVFNVEKNLKIREEFLGDKTGFSSLSIKLK